MDDYNICDQIGYFMMDTATDNKTFIDCLAQKQADSRFFLNAEEYRPR